MKTVYGPVSTMNAMRTKMAGKSLTTLSKVSTTGSTNDNQPISDSETALRVRISDACPLPTDLPLFLPYAHTQLGAHFTVRVVTSVRSPLALLTGTTRKRHGTHTSQIDQISQVLLPDVIQNQPGNEVLVGAEYDTTEHLVELRFTRCSVKLGRKLFQILALCTPYHPKLERITVRQCKFERHAFHELVQLIHHARLTEVWLDGSHVHEGCFHLLLEHEGLRLLSLSRCGLVDDEVVEFAERLQYPRPASRCLRSLSLASNAITDEGARLLSAAMRSNRVLQHLDLADNRITNEGAAHLFSVLVEFPLTSEELMNSRWAHVEYLRRLEALRKRFSAERVSSKRPMESAKGAGRQKALSVYVPSELTSKIMATEKLGEWEDPFRVSETLTCNGKVFSKGNTTLWAMNLAYNQLGYESLVALAGVVRAQAMRGEGGLIRVVLSGNPLPTACAEYHEIDKLLECAVQNRIALNAARASSESSRKDKGRRK